MILNVAVTAEGGIYTYCCEAAIPQPPGPRNPSNLRILVHEGHIRL